MGAFTLPTSVTTAPPATAARTTSATAETGVATNTTSASGSSPTASRAPRASACWARLSSRSRPLTCHPRARSAMPMLPPISPVPTTSALFGEVIPQPPRPLQVDVVQLAPRPLGGHVHEHADAQRGTALDVELPGTEQRHVAHADGAGGSGREHRAHVVGGGEDDADEVVLRHVVAVEHGAQQGLDALVHLLGGVGVDRGRAAQGSNGRGHEGQD